MHDYKAEAEKAISLMGLDMSKETFTSNDLARGIKVEYEHGRISPETNVTDDDLVKTAKIALAHLREHREGEIGDNNDYYDGLEILEHAPQGYWRGRSATTFWFNYKARIILLVLLSILCISMVVYGHCPGWFIAFLMSCVIMYLSI